MYRFYAQYKTGSNKNKYYFTGEFFTTTLSAVKSFKTIASGNKAIKAAFKKAGGVLPKGMSLHYKQTHPLTKIKREKNLTKKTVNKKILTAIENFEEFTGMTPEYIDKKDLPKLEVGFKIGTCDGLLYTTVRDGRTEKYVHKFKRRARPILVSNFDGSFIALIGGHYKFTDRGIVDN